MHKLAPPTFAKIRRLLEHRFFGPTVLTFALAPIIQKGFEGFRDYLLPHLPGLIEPVFVEIALKPVSYLLSGWLVCAFVARRINWHLFFYVQALRFGKFSVGKRPLAWLCYGMGIAFTGSWPTPRLLARLRPVAAKPPRALTYTLRPEVAGLVLSALLTVGVAMLVSHKAIREVEARIHALSEQVAQDGAAVTARRRIETKLEEDLREANQRLDEMNGALRQAIDATRPELRFTQSFDATPRAAPPDGYAGVSD